MRMQAILDDWSEHAEDHACVNRAFLRSLDRRAEKAIDRTARRLHREAFAAIDCTRCANCCKTMIPSFTDDEVVGIAEHLGADVEGLKARHLVRTGDEDELVPRHGPCPFLGVDRGCTVYERRPASCSDFPHTNRARFAAFAEFHLENAVFCPAVFYVIEQMRARGVR